MNCTRILVFATAILLHISCNKKLANERVIWTKQLDSLVTQEHQSAHFHGGIIVSKDSEVIYEKYIGIANRGSSTPIDWQTKFDIASVNKSFICALILKAVEGGKLSLNDKLVDVLKGYSFGGSFHSEITIHHLMCHLSGLPDYDAIDIDLKENSFKKFKGSSFTNPEYVDFISRLTPVNAPNTSFHYSNFAYHLLAIILENTYQQSFDVVLSKNLTKPLGLNQTVAEMHSRNNITNLADGYLFDKTNNHWNKQMDIDLSLGRRIFSTVHDLNRWGQVMSNPGYLSEQSLALMQTNHLAKITKEVSYGYGWAIFDENKGGRMGNLNINKKYIIHGGSTDGYKAMLVNINNNEYVISFLSNHGYEEELSLTKKIVNILKL
ncbi:MAG: hypothetical protein CMB99_02020 [Flavobacteriaceae bacterium]|nr:hypothetical protein [Flavobacteriaceae bacterium]|tara:strand:- start:48396 stop:49532 length:1137 start_codon:yes stop_codon:yes gene_type:complete